MKTEIDDEWEEMPDEIDFTGAVRGKYFGRIAPLDNLILIEPELFASFPSAEAVNEALRILQRAGAEALRKES